MLQTATSTTNIKRLVILLLLFCTHVGYSQLERFKLYDVAEGVCHPFIYTINQDKNGFIWAGTGEGLCRFNGYEFESFAHIDSLSNDVVSVSFKDSFENLWFGYSNGLVISWDGYDFKKFQLPGESTTGITSISETPWGDIFVSTFNKGSYLVSLSDGRVKIADEQLSKRLVSAVTFSSNAMLLGTADGMEIVPVVDNKLDFSGTLKIDQLAYINVQLIKKASDSVYFVGTEDAGVYQLQLFADSTNLIQIAKSTPLEYENIQDVLITSNNNLWICTYFSGLFKLTGYNNDGTYNYITNYNKGKGFNTNYFKSLYFDREDNIWVGTFGTGIGLLAEQSFAFLSFEEEITDNNVLSVASNDSLVWLGGDNSVLQVNINNPEDKIAYNQKNGLPKAKVIALAYSDNELWVGTDSKGIYRKAAGSDKFKKFFVADNSLGNSINYLFLDKTNLYAATKDGIHIFELEGDKHYHYNTESGLPHNDIEHIFIDNDNRLLFATRSNGIFEINERGDVMGYFTVGNYELAFNSITQDVYNHVWVSTFGQGLFMLMTDTVINITVNDGLKSNYCYGVATSDSNYVWVGHRMGISRIGIRDYAIKTFDVDFGINGDVNQNAVSVDNNSRLFFGTTDGLIVYDGSKARTKTVPPKTNIVRLMVSDVEMSFKDPIVLPYAPYKIRVEFVGLNYNDPESVKYQYKLEGYDLEWSELTDLRYALYSRVEDGDFKFQIRSYGHNGQYESTPTTFSIRIKPPFWKTWWFIISSTIIGLLLIVIVVKYREKKQKELQEYLEKSLDERTKEVVEQKEEIEVKNRDITDSINYAQRIQTSILPPIKKLQQSFSGSFVFYAPRDIVSGDFYWFDKVSDDRFVIVCADSTGHGVPGAFMSMIGTTLIKDICHSKDITSPAAILHELDVQLGNTLNQNVDAAQSNDGMDMMVCEIDINNYQLRYSSAMRPMILYKNGEQMYVKGSRSSIGGQYDGDDQKDFVDNVIQLNKGDLIYLFSDGYPDQFGGPLGKKFKMVRLKNLIADINKKPMEEQYEYVKSTFNLWKEDYDQVDDVLFMGIKV